MRKNRLQKKLSSIKKKKTTHETRKPGQPELPWQTHKPR
jgi:hypothetical protein